MLSACPAHGAFEGARCPACRHEGTPLVTSDQRTRLSKFLSGALRHFPDDAGLALDEQGWASLDALVEAATERYGFADADAVRATLALGCRTYCAEDLAPAPRREGALGRPMCPSSRFSPYQAASRIPRREPSRIGLAASGFRICRSGLRAFLRSRSLPSNV